MPRLPVYNQQRNINATPIAPFRNEADARFESEQRVINTMTNVVQQWSEANDVMQITDAKARYETASAEIQAKAAADPNFKNGQKYYKELEKARIESLKVIDNRMIANELSPQLQMSNLITGQNIQTQFKKKQIDYNKVQLKTNIDALQQKQLTAGSEEEKARYQTDIDKLITMSEGSGVLTHEEAYKMRHDAELDAVSNLIYVNPQLATAKINAGEFNLSPKESAKFLMDAKQIEKKNKEYAEWQTKQTQTQSTIQLSEALQSHSLTPTMVRDMQQQGLIDSETAAIFDSLAIDKKYEIPESTSLAEPDYFLRLLEDSMGEKTQVKKIMADAAHAYADSKIGTQQYLYFIQNAKETFERQSGGVYTKSEKQNGLFNAIAGIREFFSGKEKADKNTKKAMNSFAEKLPSGEEPAKIKDAVLNDYRVNQKPEISNFPENGKLMIDKNGNKALVYPDGRIEEVK